MNLERCVAALRARARARTSGGTACVRVESVALVYVDTGGVSLLDAGAVTA